jgi:hypothetical protein
MHDWLEPELLEQLAPVQAPDELWRRVNRVRTARIAASPSRVRTLPVAAVVTLILAGALWFMARGAGRPATYRQFPVSARGESCLVCHNTL